MSRDGSGYGVERELMGLAGFYMKKAEV